MGNNKCKENEIDLFEFYKKIQGKYPNWKNKYLKKIFLKSLFFCVTSPLILLSNSLAFYKIKNKNIKYLFVGYHFPDIIKNLPKEEIVILGPITQVKSKGKKNYWISYDWINLFLIGNYFFNIDILNLKSFVSKLLRSNSDLIVITGNDTKPLERYFIALGRKYGLSGLCIQHGIWVSENINKYELDGWFVDRILVYDQYHYNLLVSSGIPKGRIRVLGIPKETILNADYVKNRKVCIIGSGLGNNDLRKQITEANNTLFKKIEGFDEVWYKPHPKEQRSPEIDHKIQIFKGTFPEALKKFSYFIGFTSTALLEAKLNHKYVLQVQEKRIPSRNFEKIGFGIRTLNLNRVDAITGSDFTNPVNWENTKIGDSFMENFKNIVREIVDVEKFQ